MSCIICGECLENGYSIKLECSCDYQYHYECISTTLKHDKYNRCPYCATPYQLLPIVNGIKKIDNKIHKVDLDNPYENVMFNAFKVLGEVAGQELIGDKNVSEAINKFTEYVDYEKLEYFNN